VERSDYKDHTQYDFSHDRHGANKYLATLPSARFDKAWRKVC
jgi:hypothetical protein